MISRVEMSRHVQMCPHVEMSRRSDANWRSKPALMVGAVAYASCYVYSPAGTCPVSQRSRLLCWLLKAGNAEFLDRYARRVRQEADAHAELTAFFRSDALLIPVPGNKPRRAGSVPVAERLAAAFIRVGIGAAVWPGLKRVVAVRKSATAPGFERPTVGNHYRSLAVDTTDLNPQRILLVDDVVTKGRTLLAAASRVQEAFPAARIHAFALVRTMGLEPEIARLVDPCVGQIRWQGGDAHRRP